MDQCIGSPSNTDCHGILASLCLQQWRQPPSPHSSNVETIVLSFNSQREDIESEFNYLVSKWKSERNSTSSTTKIALHPAYQQIIGLGKPAIWLILRELQKELDHWFWALEAITRENPVPAKSYGKMREMAAVWLQWGRERGYVR